MEEPFRVTRACLEQPSSSSGDSKQVTSLLVESDGEEFLVAHLSGGSGCALAQTMLELTFAKGEKMCFKTTVRELLLLLLM